MLCDWKCIRLLVSLCCIGGKALSGLNLASPETGKMSLGMGMMMFDNRTQLIIARMKAAPLDSDAQEEGCDQLETQLSRDSGNEVVPLLQVMDEAATRAVAANDLTTAQACLKAITGPATFNRDYTMMMNSSTHTLENLITMLQKNPYNRDLNNEWLQSIAGSASSCCPELTPTVVALGGFEVLFNAIDKYFPNDADVMMSAWRGLSDHSHNPVGAEIIANHNGTMKGMKWMMDNMRAHPQPGYAENPYDHLSLKYEILQNVNGMAEDDKQNIYGPSFIQAGLVEQVVYTMRAEPHLRASQDVACNVMSKFVLNDPSTAQIFVDAGVLGDIDAAIKYFLIRPDSTPWGGTTLGLAYPVVFSCGSARGLLLQHSSD